MIETAPPLPDGFLIQGYRIVSLIETGENYYLYNGVSPQGVPVTIREFCPRDIAARDATLKTLSFQNNDPQLIGALKQRYDNLYYTPGTAEIQDLGTSFFISEQNAAPTQTPPLGQQPVFATREKNRRRPLPKGNAPSSAPAIPNRVTTTKKHSPVLILSIILVAVIGLGGFIAYRLSGNDGDMQEIVIKTKKQTPPPKIIAPAPEPEPEPEPVVVAPEPEPEPEPQPEIYGPSDELLAMKEQIKKSLTNAQGKIAPELYDAYIDYAEKSIREYVTKQGAQFSPAFEEWLKKTGHRAEAFAMFYPPDPSVATNIDILVNSLGERAYTYDQMVLTFAIVRRFAGMGSFDLDRRSQHNFSSRIWDSPADLFIAGKPPINYFGPDPITVSEDTFAHVRKYLRDNNLSPKKAYSDKEKTLAALSKHGVTSGNLVDYMREELYQTGQLKRKRDPYPTAAGFINYLADKFEQMGKMKDVGGKKVEWDGVAIDATPWLAMLPLSEGRPLRECESIWDRYLGKMGPKRLHRYGPYVMDDDPNPPALRSLDPHPEWSLDSYEVSLCVGGVCGTMTQMARNSQTALGSPAIPSGQPGHSCVQTIHYSGNGCWLTVDQSVSSLKNTTGRWYLNDSTAPRTGRGEYHVGNALSVNIDEQEMLKGRIGMNIYKLAYADPDEPPNPNPTLGSAQFERTTLRDILARNPFHTEARYTLFEKEGGDLPAAIRCIDELRKDIPDGPRANRLWGHRKYNKSVGRGDRKDKDHIAGCVRDYTDVISAAMLELAIKLPFDHIEKNTWNGYLSWIRSEARHNQYDDVNMMYQIITIKSKGDKNLRAEIEREFNKALRVYKRKNIKPKDLQKFDPEDLAIKMCAVTMSLEKEEALPWLQKYIEGTPLAMRFKPHQRSSCQITPFYKLITDEYMKVLPQGEAEAFRRSIDSDGKNYIAEFRTGDTW